jgi:hypothetical protein
LDGIEFTGENWVRFAKFGLGRHARSINSFNNTAFGLFLQWKGRAHRLCLIGFRRRTPGPPMNSEVFSNQVIQAHEKIGFVL